MTLYPLLIYLTSIAIQNLEFQIRVQKQCQRAGVHGTLNLSIVFEIELQRENYNYNNSIHVFCIYTTILYIDIHISFSWRLLSFLKSFTLMRTSTSADPFQNRIVRDFGEISTLDISRDTVQGSP